MMGYRSTLITSAVVLTLFYTFIGVFSFYMMGPQTLTDWLSERGLWDIDKDGIVPVTDALMIATTVVFQRFIEMLPFYGFGLTVGVVVILLVVLALRAKRIIRGNVNADSEWRGLGVTITKIPKVKPPHWDEVKIKVPRDVEEHLHDVLGSLLAYVGSNSDSYAGEGHGTSLLKHTLSVCKKALSVEDADPLLVVAAAAHDVGKITSFEREGEGWKRVSYHDKEGAKILASMPAWWALPEPDKTVLLYAVKYEHSSGSLPSKVPGLNSHGRERLLKLLLQLKKIDQSTTEEEKQVVIERTEKETSLLQVFLNKAPELCYQTEGLAKGLKAVGWRQGSRLYLIEWGVRKAIEPNLSPDRAAALETSYEHGQRLPKFSQELFKQLDEKGWLVTEAEIQEGDKPSRTVKVKKDFPLWQIETGHRTGKGVGRVFKWVFIIELPEGERGWYPERSQYRITIKSPEREEGGNPRQKTSRRKKSHNLAPEVIDIPVASDESNIELFADDSGTSMNEPEPEPEPELKSSKKRKRPARSALPEPLEGKEPQPNSTTNPLESILYGAED